LGRTTRPAKALGVKNSAFSRYPNKKKSVFEFVWEKRFGFGWEKGFELQGYGMEMEKGEGAAGEQVCSLAGVRMEEWDFSLDGRRILTFNVGVKFEMPLISQITF
jgi:hypothetical protein